MPRSILFGSFLGRVSGRLKKNGMKKHKTAETGPRCPSLSTDVVHHIVSFLDDVGLCRSQVICRDWRLPISRLETQWKKRGQQAGLVPFFRPETAVKWTQTYKEWARTSKRWTRPNVVADVKFVFTTPPTTVLATPFRYLVSIWASNVARVLDTSLPPNKQVFQAPFSIDPGFEHWTTLAQDEGEYLAAVKMTTHELELHTWKVPETSQHVIHRLPVVSERFDPFLGFWTDGKRCLVSMRKLGWVMYELDKNTVLWQMNNEEGVFQRDFAVDVLKRWIVSVATTDVFGNTILQVRNYDTGALEGSVDTLQRPNWPDTIHTGIWMSTDSENGRCLVKYSQHSQFYETKTLKPIGPMWTETKHILPRHPQTCLRGASKDVALVLQSLTEQQQVFRDSCVALEVWHLDPISKIAKIPCLVPLAKSEAPILSTCYGIYTHSSKATILGAFFLSGR